MRKLLTLFLFSLLLSDTTEAQVKITDMPTYVGNPNGGWVPIVLNNVNRKIDAKYLGYAKIDSLFTHGDTLYWRNGSGIHYFKMSVNAYDTSYLYGILNSKLTISDTTNKWLSNLRRRGVTDTIEFLKNGTWQFAYKETSGSGFDSTFIYLALADSVGTIRDSLVSIRNKIVSDSLVSRAAIALKKDNTDSTNSTSGYTTLYQNSLKQNIIPNLSDTAKYLEKGDSAASTGFATNYKLNLKVDSVKTNSDSTKLFYWVNGVSHEFFDIANSLAGSDTTIFQTVIDSTGTTGAKVLLGINKKIKSYSWFITDTLNHKVGINVNNISVGGPNTKFVVGGNALIQGNLTANSLIKSGGTNTQILLADGTTKPTTDYYLASNPSSYISTESDVIALAKTITATQGSGILITGSATQALSANPSWTFKADTSVVQTKFKSDTSRTNIYNAIAAITPGETNTASNILGLGVGIWKDKSGVDLRFKRLKNEYGVTITDRTDSIGIAVDSSCSTCPASKTYVSNAIVGLITQSQLDDSTAAVRADFPTGSGFDSSIYSADGTIRANRIVTGNQKQLLFNNLSLGKFESKSASGKAVSSVQTGGYYVNNNVAYDSTGGNHWGTHINANNYTSQLESYQTTDGYTTTDDHSITVSPNGIIIQGEVQSGGPNYMYLNLGNLPHKTTLLSTDSLIFKENNNIGGRGLGLVHTVAVSDLGFSSTFYDSTLMATQQNLKDTAAAIRADFPAGGSQGLQDVITTNPILSQYNDIETGGYGLKINNTNGTTLAASIFLDSSDVYITTSNNIGVYSQVYSDVYGANLQAGTNTTYRAINVDSAHSRVDYNGTLKNIITSINGGLADSTGNVTLSIPSAYTDEQAQDAIGAMVSGEFTYTDATPLLAINSIAASKITGTKTSTFISDFTTASQTVGDARYFQISNNLSEGAAATMRTNMGATTIGGNIFTLPNPSALGYIRANADNTVTHRSYANVKVDLGLDNVENAAASGLYVPLTSKDATGGYAGLTLFKINFKNAANTFTSFLTNTNTAARTYTFKDADGTVAFTSDITGTNSNTNTGDQNTFTSIPVSGQTTVTANSTTTALTFVAGTNTTITTDNTAKSITINSTGGATGANPTASIGLSAINGSASTFMRSDAAPALSQSIVPTWTGVHTFRQSSITTTSDGIVLENNTASPGSGTQELSPRLRLTGQGWKTAAGGASQTVDWWMENRPVQGSSNPSTNLAFVSRVNGGTATDQLILTSAGAGTFTGAITGSNLSGTNTGDQTSIVGITGTTAQFNTALTDNDFATIAGSETLTNKTLTTAVINGTITGTGQATAATASTIAMRDANANVTANSFLEGFATTATAAGTTTLTVSSKEIQEFTGSTTQTITLPVASTLVTGQLFKIINNSSGSLTVNSSGGNLVQTITGGSSAVVTCVLASGTTAASWDAQYTSSSTGTVTSVSVTTANGVSGSVATSTTTPAITLTLGAITPTTVNGNTFTTGTYTLTGAAGKTLTFNNSITLAGTDATTMTFPSTSATIARTDAANTFTGVQTMTSPAITTPAITGLATGTGVAAIATASTLVSRDASANTAVNNLLEGYTTTATAAGTTTLTVGSTYLQYFTGSTTQTAKLPVASTLVLGHQFQIVNKSSGVVTVQSSGSNTVQAQAASTSAIYTCILTSGTTAASWDVQYFTSGGGTVTSVSGTANQIASTGGATPVLSLVSGAILPGSPTIVSPGNATQNIITTDATQTLTNKTITAPVIASIVNTGTQTIPTVTGTLTQYASSATASSSTPAPAGDAKDNYFDVTALAATATFSAPSGTPTNHNTLLIRIKDNGTARTLAWNAIYRASTDFALPTTTVISKTMYVQFVYNSTDSKWDAVGLTQGF